MLLATEIEISERVPIELKIMVDSYHLMSDQKMKKNALMALQKLEQNLGHLEQRIEFLLIKNDIYKSLIEYPNTPPSSTKDNPSLFAFRSFFQKKRKQLSPLAQWVCDAALKELKPIPNIPIDDPLFSPQMKAQYHILKTWPIILKGKRVAEINHYFEQVLVNILNNLYKRVATFLKYSLDYRRPERASILKILPKKQEEKQVMPSSGKKDREQKQVEVKILPPEIENINQETQNDTPPQPVNKKQEWTPREK